MNYFEFYAGDYARDTADLTLAEHGAFLMLLSSYYSTEKPIPSDNPTLFRLVRAMTEDEQKAVLRVADKFFPVSSDDGLRHNKRADEEIVKARTRIEAARQNGKLGGRPKKPIENPVGSDSLTHQEPNGVPSTKAPHAPCSTYIKSTPIVPTGDESSVVDSSILIAYHELLPRCQRITVLNPKRKRRIAQVVKLAKQVCREQGWGYDADGFWRAYFAECTKDPWMRGEVPNPKNLAWKQNLDVLIAEDRFASVMDRAIEQLRKCA